MPKIVQFELPQSDVLQPNDRAASTAREAAISQSRAGSEAGRAIGGGISQVGGQIGKSIDQHIAMQQISHGAATYSSLFGELTDQWNQIATKSDPNDTSVKQGFMEKMLEPSLDKFTGAFDNANPQAQEWALSRADQLRQHFTQKTSADMSIRAADAAHQNITGSVANYSSVVTSDPSALGHSLDSFKSDLQSQLDANPFLDASQKAHINNELVPKATWEITKNAIWSMGKSNPDQLKQDLVTGKLDDFIPGQYKNDAIHLAEEAKRDFDRQKLIEDENAHRDLTRKQQTNFGEGVGLALSGKPLSQFKISEMVRSGELSGEQAENLYKLPMEITRQHQDKRENTPHPQEFMRVMNSIRFNQVENNVNMSDGEIWKSWNEGKINVHEFDAAMAFYKNANKPGETAFNKMLSTTEGALSSSLTVGMLKQTNPEQFAADMNSMRTDAYYKFETARNSGQDVSKILDPKSNDYLFKNAAAYFTHPTAAMQAGADKVRGAAKPQQGVIVDGYRFKGGDPADSKNWEKVE